MEIKKSLPLVSFIVPCYNHQDYVCDAIESIVNQTYKNIEIIVIDDYSTDDSQSKLKSLSFKYDLKLVFHKSNQGLTKTLNEGLKLARGSYISLMASDDIIKPNNVELLMNIFRSARTSDVSVVFGDADFINEKNELVKVESFSSVIAHSLKERSHIKLSENVEYADLLFGNFIPAISSLISREHLERVGGFDERLCLEDIPLWLKLAQDSKIIMIEDSLSYYRIHSSNITKTLKPRIVKDFVMVLIDNRQFCYRDNRLKQIWNRKYLSYIKALYLVKEYKMTLSSILSPIFLSALIGYLKKEQLKK